MIGSGVADIITSWNGVQKEFLCCIRRAKSTSSMTVRVWNSSRTKRLEFIISGLSDTRLISCAGVQKIIPASALVLFETGIAFPVIFVFSVFIVACMVIVVGCVTKTLFIGELLS